MGVARYPDGSVENNASDGFFLYKTSVEVRRDMILESYLAELMRSPLDRGVVVMRSAQLRACSRVAENRLRVASFGVGSTPVQELGFSPGHSRPRGQRLASADDPIDSAAVLGRWASLDAQLAQQVASSSSEAGSVLALTSPRVVELLLQGWSVLDGDDPQNLPLERAATALGLSAASVSAPRAAGASDLAGVARALSAAAPGERYNRDLAELRRQLAKQVLCRFDAKSLEATLAVQSAERIRVEIGKSKVPTPPPSIRRGKN